MDAYTLKKKKETNEYHLFKGVMSLNGCSSEQKSLCEMMNKSESAGNKFGCKNEDDARTECAKIGRAVCGVCVSQLYTTYE